MKPAGLAGGGASSIKEFPNIFVGRKSRIGL